MTPFGAEIIVFARVYKGIMHFGVHLGPLRGRLNRQPRSQETPIAKIAEPFPFCINKKKRFHIGNGSAAGGKAAYTGNGGAAGGKTVYTGNGGASFLKARTIRV